MSIKKLGSALKRMPFHPQWLLGRLRHEELIEPLRGVVLDIGCSDRWAEEHAVGATYIGLDYPETGILYGARPDVYGTAMHLPFGQACVDVILCFEVIEHLKHPQQAIREMARVCKQDGMLLLTMPFLYPIHDAPNDFQRLTSHGLERDLNDAGFEIVSLRKRGHAVKTAGLLLSLSMIGGIASRRSHLDKFRIFITLPLITLINLSCAVAANFVPDWSAIGHGYEVVARRIVNKEKSDS